MIHTLEADSIQLSFGERKIFRNITDIETLGYAKV